MSTNVHATGMTPEIFESWLEGYVRYTFLDEPPRFNPQIDRRDFGLGEIVFRLHAFCSYGDLPRVVTIRARPTGRGLALTWEAEEAGARAYAADMLAAFRRAFHLESDNPRSNLLQNLDRHFSEEELRTLCFELRVDYENLSAQGKAGKVRELILHLERVGRTDELIDRCRKLRPNISWEDTSGLSPVVDPE
jgi:hypothetical protein